MSGDGQHKSVNHCDPNPNGLIILILVGGWEREWKWGLVLLWPICGFGSDISIIFFLLCGMLMGERYVCVCFSA